MYAEHFGFIELPFSVTPDPQTFFSNSVYQEAFAALQYGVLAKKGFVVLTGEVGTGKTTLLRKLLRSLGPTAHSVFIFNTQVSFEELLRMILDDLNLPRNDADKLTMIEILNQFLIERLRQGHIVALLIDEAQNLCDEVMEGLRLLSNLETDTQKLLQIVLVGQPELETKLDDSKLRQLKQRISFQLRLTPLKTDEVSAYIQFRLSAVGFRGKNPFNGASVQAIASYSNGIPRLINIICDNALLAAFAASNRKVSAKIVEEVARDLQLNRREPIETPRLGTDRIADNAETSIMEKDLPQFENIFAGSEDKYRTDLRQKRSLLLLGVGLLMGAMFLGGIAVLYSPPTRISLSDLATTWEYFSREGRNYLSDSTVKFQEFFATSEQYAVDAAVKAEEASIKMKNYLQAEVGDLYRVIAEYLNGLIQDARDFSQEENKYFSQWRERASGFFRRSKTGIAGLAAGMGEVFSRVKSVKNVGLADTSFGDSHDVNPSKGTEPLLSDSAIREGRRFAGPESIEPTREARLPTAEKPANPDMPENTEPPTTSSAMPNNASHETTESKQLTSPERDRSPVQRPTQLSPQRSLGNFEVVENSFVRDKPQDNAEIISTLLPGTRVRVESKTGKYFRVRSLDDPAVKGYIHEEDAFFKRSK